MLLRATCTYPAHRDTAIPSMALPHVTHPGAEHNSPRTCMAPSPPCASLCLCVCATSGFDIPILTNWMKVMGLGIPARFMWRSLDTRALTTKYLKAEHDIDKFWKLQLVAGKLGLEWPEGTAAHRCAEGSIACWLAWGCISRVLPTSTLGCVHGLCRPASMADEPQRYSILPLCVVGIVSCTTRPAGDVPVNSTSLFILLPKIIHCMTERLLSSAHYQATQWCHAS